MSKHNTLPKPIEARRNKTEIQKLYLMGESYQGIAAQLGLDYDTVRRYHQDGQAEIASQIENLPAFRIKLVELWNFVVAKAVEEYDSDPSPARQKALVSLLQAAIDVTGIRQYKVDVGSSQFERLLKQMASARGEVVEATNVKVIELPMGDVEAGEIIEKEKGE